MTTNNAFRIAMKNEEFVKHHEKVQRYAEEHREHNGPCLVFVVDDEYFYYGYDGCEVVKGKYRPKVADRFRKDGFGLVIR